MRADAVEMAIIFLSICMKLQFRAIDMKIESKLTSFIFSHSTSAPWNDSTRCVYSQRIMFVWSIRRCHENVPFASDLLVRPTDCHDADDRDIACCVASRAEDKGAHGIISKVRSRVNVVEQIEWLLLSFFISFRHDDSIKENEKVSATPFGPFHYRMVML